MAGCACLDKPLPCLIQDRTNSANATPFDQLLSVQVGTEYELDWNLFPGLKEWTPEKTALLIKPVTVVSQPTRISPVSSFRSTPQQMHTPSPQSNYMLQQRLQEQTSQTTRSLPHTISYGMPRSMGLSNNLDVSRSMGLSNHLDVSRSMGLSNNIDVSRSIAGINTMTATVQSNVPRIMPTTTVSSSLAYTPVRSHHKQTVRPTQQEYTPTTTRTVRPTQQEYTPTTTRTAQAPGVGVTSNQCQCPNCSQTPTNVRSRSRVSHSNLAGTMPSSVYSTIKVDQNRNWDYLSLYNQQHQAAVSTAAQGVHYFTPPRQVGHGTIQPDLQQQLQQQLARSAPVVAHRRMKVIPAVQNLAALSSGPVSPLGASTTSAMTFPHQTLTAATSMQVHAPQGHGLNAGILPFHHHHHHHQHQQNTISYFPEPLASVTQQQHSSLLSHHHYLQACLENQTLDYFPDMKRKLDVDFSLSDPFQDAKRRKLSACFVDHVGVRDNGVQVNRQLIRGY